MKKEPAKKTVKETSPTGLKWQGPGDRSDPNKGAPAGIATLKLYKSPLEYQQTLRESAKKLAGQFCKLQQHLNLFNNSRYTKEMVAYINIDVLKKMIRTCRIIYDHQEEEYTGDLALMEKEFKKLNKGLEKLCKKKWLNPSDKDEIKARLFTKIWQSQNGQKHIIYYAKGKPIGRPQDVALNALAYWLCQSLKKKTGRPQYNLILNFLQEQEIGIADEGTTNYESFKKRLQGLKTSVLEVQYEKIRAGAIAVIFLGDKVPKMSSEMDGYFAEEFIPPFKSFLEQGR